jgi:hypothetical protein
MSSGSRQAVKELLAIACDTCIAGSLICSQARELLKRVADCSVAIALQKDAAIGR